jgi:hypothetical protein
MACPHLFSFKTQNSLEAYGGRRAMRKDGVWIATSSCREMLLFCVFLLQLSLVTKGIFLYRFFYTLRVLVPFPMFFAGEGNNAIYPSKIESYHLGMSFSGQSHFLYMDTGLEIDL